MLPSLLPKLFFISLLSTIISAANSIHSYKQCLDDQKTLLLVVKSELIFDSSKSIKLVQWNQTDECCSWYGVECDGAGNVISLQLDGEAISGGIGDASSLFRLKHLMKLNLAYNDFNYTQIPRGIQNLSYLTHLNLSNAAFGDQVPLQLSLLRRLVSLDISNSYWDIYRLKKYLMWDIEPLKLERPNLEMIVQNLTGLRELYLDAAYFPPNECTKWSHIISSYLPDLTSLSLSYCSVSGPLNSLLKLDSLSILRLDGNNLSTVVPDLFVNFLSLTTLSLGGCNLKGPFPKRIFQITSLQNLDLSFNRLLSGTIPSFSVNGSLQSIMVSSTGLSGLIPSSTSNLKNLSLIDLSSCYFSGPIPSTFANLTKLTLVDLYNNSFTGSLSSTLFERLSSLSSLVLRSNSFTGNIPKSLFGLSSLQNLDLGLNQFIGQVKEFPSVNASNILIYLDLSRNKLEGTIPYSLLQLQRLTHLDLSHNLFNGTVQLEKFQNLPNLGSLVLSHNYLSVDTENISSSSYYPQLRELGLASCDLYNIPNFIKHTDMSVLDLSNNRIAGEIPSWLWGVGRQFYEMNLSSNHLTGFEKTFQIHPLFSQIDLSSNQLQGELYLPISKMEKPLGLRSDLSFLSVANNNLSGSIPTSLCNATSLMALDLSLNKLSGEIPPCLLQNRDDLQAFMLGTNNFSGHIPDNFSLNCNLQYFDLNNNNLQGKIPKSLESCRSLEFMNVGNNLIHDTFPCMISPSLRVLVLRSNRFHGEVRCQTSWPNLQIIDISSNNLSGTLESMNFSSWRAMMLKSDDQLRHNRSGTTFLKPTYYYYPYPVGVILSMKGIELELVKIWPDFIAVDLSCNNFQGEIPNAIGDLSSLYVLSLSHNALNGSIPHSVGKLKELGSLDLSENQLTGMIPVELAGITFLSYLNLSYNKLVGVIPNGPQLRTFTDDSFKENSGLCGFPLNISCSNTSEDNDLSPPDHEDENDEAKEIEWEYVCGALGYVVGLGSFLWVLLCCQNFRERYFEQLDDVVEKMLVRRHKRGRHGRGSVVRNHVRRQ